MLGHNLHFDWVTQVGLVSAVPKGGVRVRDQRPDLVHLRAVAEFLKHATQNRLNCVEHILLLYETHLQVQLVEICG